MMSSRTQLDSESDSESMATAAATGGKDETSAAGARAPEGKRVLVVDDNEDAAELLREILSCLGHRVEVAYDGATALKLAESFRPEVALLDIGMPVMNGYELAARLRKSAGPTPRLIAITGYGADAIAGEEGFDQHLIKPFDVNRLRELIAQPSSAVTAAPSR
jgi:CheY-like chemotaxis protein